MVPLIQKLPYGVRFSQPERDAEMRGECSGRDAQRRGRIRYSIPLSVSYIHSKLHYRKVLAGM